ncbi:MAG: hypothetical protein ACKPJJ_01295, partial [Planctomycetaceae bacterium]
VCMMPAAGDAIWFGGLSQASQYELLITWAESCQIQRQLLRLPAALDRYRFVRFARIDSGA